MRLSLQLKHLLRWSALAVLVSTLGSTSAGGASCGQQPDAPAWLTFEPPAGIACGKTIFLLSGDEEYRSEEALPMLGRLLSQRFGFRCVVVFPIDPASGEIDPENQVSLPGLERVAEADLIIMAWRFRQPTDAAMRVLDDCLQRGVPVIGLRTSTHAFLFPESARSSFPHYSYNSGPPWPGGFGRQFLGETWISHHGDHGTQSTRGIPEPSAAGHPILQGVADVWGPTDVYGVTDLPEGTTILMRGQILNGMQTDSPPLVGDRNDPMMPLVWCREIVPGSLHALLDQPQPERTSETDAASGEGGKDSREPLPPQRIVCTTMGAATDFVEPGLRRLVVNSALWCLRMEEQIDPAASVDLVGEYHPSGFGFGAFRKGVRPADFRDGIPPLKGQ